MSRSQFSDRSATEAETRERLLDAAEPLFASYGFRDVGVRQITAAAGVNVAAVNYHFGGKEKLYLEMMHRRLSSLRATQLEGIRSVMATKRPAPTVERLVRGFTSASIAPVSLQGGTQLLRLFFREIGERRLPEELWRPGATGIEEAFSTALRRLEPRLPPVIARQCLRSIEDLLSGVFQRAEIEGTAAQGRVGDVAFEDAIEHVIRFSVAGIRACTAGAR